MARCGSMVIPAHNEGATLARCLDSVASEPSASCLEVVVVPNGCTDRTADVARQYVERIPGLRVIELSEASKTAALNAGDAACSAFPRVFLDADIELGPGALSGLLDALDVAEARVASPRVVFDYSRAGTLVREFYRAYERLPYVRDGLIGLGVYAVSAAGRARFDRFPDVTADDLFVQRLFSADERQITRGTFTVRTPRTTASLLRVRTRVAHGNAELAASALSDVADTSTTTSATMAALVSEVRHDVRLAPAAVAYVGVVVAGRIRARRAGSRAWWRDDSSRD
jgi:glycosyltransferase involved in cell wall biosynthesis